MYNKMSDKEAVIIGAGWSGLACAVTLAHHGYKVYLLESARQVGGRARKVNFKRFLSNQTIDNGQHIMLGAYHATISLFKLIGIKENEFLERHPLELNMYSPDNSLIKLKAPSLPAPLHLLLAFSKMKGLNFTARFKIIKMALNLAIIRYQLKQDMSVGELLKNYSQPQEVIAALWEPLCLATMNTPIKYASAQVFLNVLKDSFSKKNTDSDLLFFRHNLSNIFCLPATEFITRRGGQVLCEEKVLGFECSSQNKVLEFIVKTSKHQFKCHNLVIATPAHITDRLLQNINNQPLINKRLANKQKLLKPAHASLHYKYEPICTIYLQYPTSTQLPGRMVGLFNTTAQWAIDRSLTNQPGLIAVIISGPGKHTQMPDKLLANTVHQELCLCISDLPEVLHYQVITEKKATFSCVVNIEYKRPYNDTNIQGLFLAGDYTNTHYPATLEGAIRSGQTAAEKIIARNSFSHFTL